MTELRIINQGEPTISQLDSDWEKVDHFKSKNKIVDIDGRPVRPSYQGHTYQIVSKDRKVLTDMECFGRVVVAIIVIAITAFIALASKAFRKWITMKTESIIYAIPFDQQPNPLPLPKGSVPGTSSTPNTDPNLSSKQAVDTKPKPSLPQIEKLLEAYDKKEFIAEMKSLSAKDIFEGAKTDSFGLADKLKYSWFTFDKRFDTIFEALTDDEKMLAFIEGALLCDQGVELCYEIIKYINGQKDDKYQKKLFAELYEAIRLHGNVQWFKNLEQKQETGSGYFRDTLVPFVRFLIVDAFESEDFDPQISDVKKGFEKTLPKALKDDSETHKFLLQSLYIGEWKALQTWGEKNSVKVPKLPEKLVKYEKHKADPKAVSDLLDDVLKGYGENLELRPILLEMSAAESAIYVKGSPLFKADKIYQWPEEKYLKILVNIPKKKQQEFVALTLASSKEKAQKISKTLEGYSYEKPAFDYVKSVVNEVCETVSSAEFLAQFKAKRKLKDVSNVLAEALKFGKKGAGFKAIAQEITEEELRLYVDLKNDCFGLKDMALSSLNNYFVGILTHLSSAKLKVFLEAIFKWPHGNLDRIFSDLVKATGSLDGIKQQEACSIIVEWLLASEERPYLFLPSLTSDKKCVSLFGNYLTAICKYAEPWKGSKTLTAFRMNESLFEEALKDGLQKYGTSPEEESKLKAWFEEKQKEANDLRKLSGEEEVKEAFKKCRDKPDLVRALLRNSINYADSKKLGILAPEMTTKEIGVYASMEYNCFGIPAGSYSHTQELWNVFGILKDFEQINSFLMATVERKDTIGRVGLLVTLFAGINSLGEVTKKQLFKTMLGLLIQQKQYDNFKDHWMDWNDGSGGKVLPAMSNFAKFLKESLHYSEASLGMLYYAIKAAEKPKANAEPKADAEPPKAEVKPKADAQPKVDAQPPKTEAQPPKAEAEANSEAQPKTEVWDVD